MSNSNISDKNPRPPPSDDVIFISGSLLEDVHINFGQEEEEEDSVFDQNLMHYLEQLPIAAPPAEAKYSASFVDSVLNDMETFKQEANYLSYSNTNEAFTSPLLDYSLFESEEAYSLEQDAAEQAFSVAVEQPRGYDSQQEQLYQEQEEIPIRFDIRQDNQSSVMHSALSLDHSTEYSDYLDLFNLSQDQPNNNEFEATFLAQRKAELDTLFNLKEDPSKDFSSWFHYSDDDGSQIRFKDDMFHPTTSAVPDESANYTFSTEYPIESKKETKSLFSTIDYPSKKSHLSHSKVQPPVQTDFAANYAYEDMSHQEVNDFLQRMGALVAKQLTQAGPADAVDIKISNNKPSPPSVTPANHAKTNVKRKARQNSSVNISKADFMFVNSTSSFKHNIHFSDIGETSEHDNSFAKRIVGTSTPVKKNSMQNLSSRQYLGSSKRRTTVLEEVDKNSPSTSSNSHRYGMRARTSPGVIRKAYSTPSKPVKSRTFDLS
ncbi:hypothetical protein MAM1_0614d11020, partial [Mucor ambiguus]